MCILNNILINKPQGNLCNKSSAQQFADVVHAGAEFRAADPWKAPPSKQLHVGGENSER